MGTPAISVVAKAAAALAVGFATVAGANHLLGDDRNSPPAPQLASAQIDMALAQLPADALTLGKTLPLAGAPLLAIPAPQDCTAVLNATLLPGAMVRLTASAPCDANAPLQFRHEGLIFDMLTDANGALSVDVPALASIALFEADLDGLPLRTIAAIPDFDSFARVALQWRGQTGLSIHALELGADMGSDGHVWDEAPGTPARALQARGGFLTHLGDPTLANGHAAQVYIFPAGLMQATGTVRLSVEAEISALTCGRAIDGQVLQPGADGMLKRSDLTLEVSACDNIGEILVLKNLLQDMKIASN